MFDIIIIILHVKTLISNEKKQEVSDNWVSVWQNLYEIVMAEIM